jgi:GT2 family glycosyltransferase
MVVKQPLIYVIVLNYNGRRWLEACCRSLLATEYERVELLLVDNASDDGSVELVKSLFPQIEIISNAANEGFSEGNNIGIRHALAHGADYVVLLNSDVKVKPDWLGHLVSAGESCAEIGILGAVQLSYEGEEFNSWTTKVMTRHLDELRDTKMARAWIPVEWVEGACFAVKRAVFAKIGLLDPIYFSFFEEIDFCRRASCAGYKVALVPRSRIHHYRGGSWEINPASKRRRDYLCDRSQFIYNLTDPRGSLIQNIFLYLRTLVTKGHDIAKDFSSTRLWDLLRMQAEILGQVRPVWHKWQRDRMGLR